MMGLKPENDINQNLKAPEIRTGEIHGLTENSKNQTCSNLFNPRRRRTINQSFGKIVQGSLEKVQGSKFDVVNNRRVSNIQPIQGIQPIQLIHSNHSSHSLPFLLILFFSLFLTASGFSQRIIYVSPNGSSIPPYDSWETAADTINKAISVFQNGDTILIGAGVYKQRIIINTHGLNYVIMGVDPDSCILDLSYLPSNSGGKSAIFYEDREDTSQNAKSDTIVIKNLRMKTKPYTDHKGITIWGPYFTYHTPYVILENLHLERTIQDGVFYWFATGEVRNCIFRNEDIGIYVQELAYRGPDVIIENNLFHYNGQAIVLYAWSHAKILNNHFVGTGYLQNTGTGLSSVIKNNLFITEINTYGNAILEFDNATIENNTIINGWYGIEVTKNCRVRNNIFHNQIYHALNFRNYTGGSYDISYNMYTDSNRVSTDTTRYRADSTDVFCADPMFVNNPYQYWFIGPPPGGYDYHLEAYSPAIDRGDPMILDKDGSRSDMGMYGGPWGERYEYQDNPPKQVKITRAYRKGEGISELNWRGGTEADFNEFRIYRGTDPGFIPDTTNLIYRGRDTLLTDTVAIPGWYSYKTEGVDNQGNRSKRDSVYFSLTDTETEPPVMTPQGYKLYHNYPNPFNPVTKIKFRTEAENEVILRVYNVEGEIVSVLENGILPAGEYEREFSPKSRGTLEDLSSGVYFYRLIVRDNNKRPVFMDAGKMVMVK